MLRHVTKYCRHFDLPKHQFIKSFDKEYTNRKLKQKYDWKKSKQVVEIRNLFFNEFVLFKTKFIDMVFRGSDVSFLGKGLEI